MCFANPLFRLVTVAVLAVGFGMCAGLMPCALGQKAEEAPAPEALLAHTVITPRAPEPDKAAQTEAEAILRSLFEAEFKASKSDKEAALKLAETLVKEGKVTRDDPALKYVAFRQAVDLALTAGQTEKAMSALDEMGRHFNIDVWAIKRPRLLASAEQVKTAKEAVEAINTMLAFLAEQRADERFEGVGEVVAAAEKLLPLIDAGKAFMTEQIKKEAEACKSAENQLALLAPHFEKLKEKADDPEANLEIGKHFVLKKGNLGRGLPYLAKGKDAALKALAEGELSATKDPKKQMELADAWAKLAAEKERRAFALRRAFFWYQAALPQLEGLTRLRVQKRVTELAEEFRLAHTNSLGMKMVLIPPGKFMMGAPEGEEGRRPHEGPQHEVRITKAFMMCAHETTLKNFREFVKASEYQTDPERAGQNDTWKNPGWNAADDDPVVNVSWNDAVAFCAWLSKKENRKYRLPTEAEWEYACRAGTKTATHYGDTLTGEQANIDGTNPYRGKQGPYLRKGTKVGSYQPNAFGLHDMHGNAWEWCQDFYDANYYANSPKDDPQGPPNGTTHALRGGGWFRAGADCRAAMREPYPPTSVFNNTGFRVVCETK